MLALSTVPLLLLIAVQIDAQATTDTKFTVLGYRALGRSDLDERRLGERYEFKFCVCPSRTSYPDEAPNCRCSSTILGRSVLDSLPDTTYSTGCIFTENPDRCLSAHVLSGEQGAPAHYVYVRIQLAGQPLTNPLWQQLRETRMRTKKYLSGHAKWPIELTYVVNSSPVQPSTTSARPSSPAPSTTPSSTTSARTTPSSSTTAATTTTELATLAPSTTVAVSRSNGVVVSPGPSITGRPVNPLMDFSEVAGISNLWGIRNYLMQMSSLHRENPAIFDYESYRHLVLAYHNLIRARHSAPPVEMSYQVQESAQQWANYLASNYYCLQHQPRRIYGESLFTFTSYTFPDVRSLAMATVQSFYMEQNNYNYNYFQPAAFYRTGHFTQLVWRNSRRIGVGVAIRRGGGWGPCAPANGAYIFYVVVRYDPPGNVMSSYAFQNNVLRARY